MLRVVNGARVTSARRSRVYTISTAWLLALATLLAGGADARTSSELGADPTMIKGAPAAPVTIVEFSDYQ
jgi:protein-disulfide isomerase